MAAADSLRKGVATGREVAAGRPPRILLAVTGCAQAEAIPRLVASLQRHPDLGPQEVIVAATEAALRFFDSAEVEAKTGERVFVDHFDGTARFPVPHISLVEWADGLIVYPASANTIAKCAHGICDSLVASLVLAARCPVYFGPSMNEAMYENVIHQRNLAILQEASYQLIPRETARVLKRATGEIVSSLFCTEAMVLSVCELIAAGHRHRGVGA